MRTKAQRDANEPEIVEALRKAGYFVTRLNDPGVPDLLVINSGTGHCQPIKVVRNAEAALAFADQHTLCLIEVKGQTSKLNKVQSEWWKNAAGITEI